jgi:hypothetical protein
MSMLRASVVAFAVGALTALPASAQDQPPQPQMQGSVAYVSGIGDQEQEAIGAAERDYNLWLTFAQQGVGEEKGRAVYLAGVPVKIFDARGSLVLMRPPTVRSCW